MYWVFRNCKVKQFKQVLLQKLTVIVKKGYRSPKLYFLIRLKNKYCLRILMSKVTCLTNDIEQNIAK